MPALSKSLNIPARLLWHVPFKFRMCRLLGSQDLRCVLFHNVAENPGPFVDRLQVTVTPRHFERVICFLAAHYTPVSLDDVISNRIATIARPVLVTFDDAYASVAGLGADICEKHGVPALFFVNAKYVDNEELAIDNLLCYICNTLGMEKINIAIKATGRDEPKLVELRDVFGRFLPKLSIAERANFERELVSVTALDIRRLAQEASLYLSRRQLADLPRKHVEIGNHTYSHVNCRALNGPDFETEIDRNKSDLEAITGSKVRAFSVPYGSRQDLTPELERHLKNSAHQAAFLVESAANTTSTNMFRLSRVSVVSDRESDLFAELELLPRIRAIRNHFRTSDSVA
jgi:peptidoglycan/xylan/chitin deacetylase (PgdA/CDA1 family)